MAEKLAALKTADYFVQRAAMGDLNAALAMLNRSSGQVSVVDNIRL